MISLLLLETKQFKEELNSPLYYDIRD